MTLPPFVITFTNIYGLLVCTSNKIINFYLYKSDRPLEGRNHTTVCLCPPNEKSQGNLNRASFFFNFEQFSFF